jgi:hypothetical protein
MDVQTLSNRHLKVPWDGMLELSAEDAEPLIRAGWPKLGDLIDDEPFADKQIENRDTPEGLKITYAFGSLECEAAIKKEVAACKAAEEEQEKRRLARVATFLGKKS